MGYTTKIKGAFSLNRKLTSAMYEFLKKFSETRRMARALEKRYGIDGEFCVDGHGNFVGDFEDANVIDHNRPPRTQPGLWCGWVPTTNRRRIKWNGLEKFYEFPQWLNYLIVKFLAPNGYILNGKVSWQGENDEDKGILEVKDNAIQPFAHCEVGTPIWPVMFPYLGEAFAASQPGHLNLVCLPKDYAELPPFRTEKPSEAELKSITETACFLRTIPNHRRLNLGVA